MDNINKDRVEGTADKIKGNVKETAGNLTDDPNLESEGQADQAEGAVQDTVGKAKSAFGNIVDKIKGDK